MVEDDVIEGEDGMGGAGGGGVPGVSSKVPTGGVEDVEDQMEWRQQTHISPKQRSATSKTESADS